MKQLNFETITPLSSSLEMKVPQDVFNSWLNMIEVMEDIFDISTQIFLKDEFMEYGSMSREKLNEGPEKNGGEKINFNTFSMDSNNSQADNGNSTLGFPVYWPTGELIGTIMINSRKPLTALKNSLEKKFLNSIKKSMETELRLIHKNAILNASNNNMREGITENLNLDMTPVICSYCKKLKDKGNIWNRIEHFFHVNFKLEFSHGICPECSEELFRNIEQQYPVPQKK